MDTPGAADALPSPNRDRNGSDSYERALARKTPKVVQMPTKTPRNLRDPGVCAPLLRPGSGFGRCLGSRGGACPLVLGEHELADPDRDRGDLDTLVLTAELQRLLQTQFAGGDQSL
jgi:hypothetical protein